MSTILRTPDLARTVDDYTGVLGFTCRQHIPGVIAVVEHGPVRLQLWACGAMPGPGEQADSHVQSWRPEQHSVAVCHIHALFASLRQSILRAVRTSVNGTRSLNVHRLPEGGPVLQPWGAWEFSFKDIDGHAVHCVDWGLCQRAGARRVRGNDWQVGEAP